MDAAASPRRSEKLIACAAEQISGIGCQPAAREELITRNPRGTSLIYECACREKGGAPFVSALNDESDATTKRSEVAMDRFVYPAKLTRNVK